MARHRPPRKITYFEPIPPRLARNRSSSRHLMSAAASAARCASIAVSSTLERDDFRFVHIQHEQSSLSILVA